MTTQVAAISVKYGPVKCETCSPHRYVILFRRVMTEYGDRAEIETDRRRYQTPLPLTSWCPSCGRKETHH